MSERELCRRLLRLLPGEFRQRNGAEIEETTLALLAESRGLSRILLWIRLVVDACRFGLSERRKLWRGQRRRVLKGPQRRIPGSIDGGVFVATGGFPIAEPSPTLPPDVGPVICCVRPHEIAPGDTGTAASVVVVEPTGADTQVVLRLGETSIVSVVRGRTSVRPGDQVRLKFNGNKLYFFDRETGRRISVRPTE